MSAEGLDALKAAQAKIRADYKEVGSDGEELANRICKSFQSAYDRPPLDEFQQILQRNMTADEVRVCLFAPRDDQVKYYPILLLAGCQPEVRNLGETHPLMRLKSLILSTMFLLHRFSWKGFLEEFVIRGGLMTLVEMLTDNNLYFRGQIVEMFLTITDCDGFDWFVPRSDAVGRTLHIRLLELTENSLFLDNIIINRKYSFPGGSMRCLQLLAFWLSWVRAMYTKNQQLILSTKLLSELSIWAETGSSMDSSIDISDIGGSKDDVIEADDAPNPEAIEEEKKLAKTLYNDFSHDQFQRRDDELSEGQASSLATATDTTADSSSDANILSVSGIHRPEIDKEVKARVSEAFTKIDDSITFNTTTLSDQQSNNDKQIPLSLSREEIEKRERDRVATVMKREEEDLRQQTAKELRERGNSAFGRGDYIDALTLYGYALDSFAAGRIDNTNDSYDNEKILSALHFNTAACYWKIYTKKQNQGVKSTSHSSQEYMDHSLLKRTKDMDVNEILYDCENHCKKALDIEPLHFKAGYRLGAVHLAQGRAKIALQAVENALEAIATAAKDTSTEASYTQLRELRTRCMAANMLQLQNDGENAKGGARDGAVSKRTAGVLAALQRRKQREDVGETHALSSTYELPKTEDETNTIVESNVETAKITKKKIADSSSDADVSAYFGASNVYTGSSSTSNKNTRKSSSKSSSLSVAGTVDKEAEARKAKKIADKKAAKKRVQEGLALLKVGVRNAEKSQFSDEIMNTQQLSMIQALETVWSTPNGGKGKHHTLASAFEESATTLEEPMVIALITLSQRLLTQSESQSIGVRCATELVNIERFNSVLSMSKFGSPTLVTACAAVHMALQGNSEVSEKVAAALA
jgi:hypothetical protein